MSNKGSFTTPEKNGIIKPSQHIKKGDKVAHFEQDVWSIFTPLAAQLNAVNLGQGFMNFPPPDFVKEAAKNAIMDNECNQYSHPKGRIRLRKALAKAYEPLFGNRNLDPEMEIIVTAGANGGMYAIFAGYLDDGDEVILMEPFFDQYVANITMNGGVPVYIPLRVEGDSNSTISSAKWTLDIAELRSKITPRTKIIVLNTPHNPVGKVFSRDELHEIGQVAIDYNLLIISDEVYDRLYFRPDTHERIANLPGMWERTITVGSGGKTFGTTGWRVGWLIGPAILIETALAAHTRILFCTNSPLQEAIAIGFEKADENQYFDTQIVEYGRKRDKLMRVFDELGLPYTIPQGSYFILVNTSRIKIPPGYPFPAIIKNRPKDFQTCYWLAKEIGVVGIPPSEFYSPPNRHLAVDYARFAFFYLIGASNYNVFFLLYLKLIVRLFLLVMADQDITHLKTFKQPIERAKSTKMTVRHGSTSHSNSPNSSPRPHSANNSDSLGIPSALMINLPLGDSKITLDRVPNVVQNFLIEQDLKQQSGITWRMVLQNLSLIGLWYFFSTALSFYNKYLMGRNKFNLKLPIFVSAIHTGLHFLVTYALMRGTCPAVYRKPEGKTVSRKSYITRVIPTAIAAALEISTSNASLVFITLTFYTMVKSSAPIWVLCFAFLFRLEQVRLSLIGIILVISFGVILTVAGEAKFNLLGFLLVFGSGILSGLRWSLTQMLLQKEDGLNNPITTLFYVSPIMFACMFILSLIFEDPLEQFSTSEHFRDSETSIKTFFLMLAGGFLAFFMTLAEFALIQNTSTVTLSVAGISKELLVITLSVLINKDEITYINVLGLVISISGIAAYNYYKIKAHKDRKGKYQQLPLNKIDISD
ncbi:hypothetical protein G9A89_008698 [Geosiphon pyriformis]|nr:hypothetical protein G9A89_008698 [Geosiphon pyriformis]